MALRGRAARARRPARAAAQSLRDRADDAGGALNALDFEQSGARHAARALRARRRRHPLVLRQPHRALPRLRVPAAARRQALQRARCDDGGGQGHLDLGARAHRGLEARRRSAYSGVKGTSRASLFGLSAPSTREPTVGRSSLQPAQRLFGTCRLALAAASGPLKVSTTRSEMMSTRFCASMFVTSAAKRTFAHSYQSCGLASRAKRHACAAPFRKRNAPRAIRWRIGEKHRMGSLNKKAKETP